MYTVTKSEWNNETKTSRVASVTQHAVGLTLSFKTESVQVMSDIWESQIYVRFWNPDANALDGCYLGTNETVVADATPEVVRAYIAWETARQMERFKESAKASYYKEFARVAKDKMVKVTGGKNSAHLVGKGPFKVFHMMEKQYNMGFKSQPRMMAGLALDDEMHDVVGKNGKTYQSYKNVAWVWAHNLEVVGVDEKMDAVEAEIKETAKSRTLGFITQIVNEIQQSQKLSAGRKVA